MICIVCVRVSYELHQGSYSFIKSKFRDKITEVQGSAILIQIFPLRKAHVTAQETATCSTETSPGRHT